MLEMEKNKTKKTKAPRFPGKRGMAFNEVVAALGVTTLLSFSLPVHQGAVGAPTETFLQHSIQKIQDFTEQINWQTNPNEPRVKIDLLGATATIKHPFHGKKGGLVYSPDSIALEAIANRFSHDDYGVREVVYERESFLDNRLCIIHKDGNACVTLPPDVQMVNTNTFEATSESLTTAPVLT